MYVFMGCEGLSLAVVSVDHCWQWCGGLSSRWPLLLQSVGSRARGLGSCGTQTQPLPDTWDPPRPGTELVSPHGKAYS